MCLFKKKEITTAYLVESKEQTVKNQGPLLNATLAVIVLEMIHVLIVTWVKKKKERRKKKREKGSEKDSVAMVKNLFKISPKGDKTPYFYHPARLCWPPLQAHLLTLTNFHGLK